MPAFSSNLSTSGGSYFDVGSHCLPPTKSFATQRESSATAAYAATERELNNKSRKDINHIRAVVIGFTPVVRVLLSLTRDKRYSFQNGCCRNFPSVPAAVVV